MRTAGKDRFSKSILSEYLAPGIAEFTTAELPDLKPEFPDAEHWIRSHFLNSVFRGSFEGEFLQRNVIMLYRAHTVFDAYALARTKTLEFLDNSEKGRPNTRFYFEALAAWEQVILNLQMILDLIKTAAKDIDLGDDSLRICKVANRVKHVGEDVAEYKHSGLTVPMWMTNEGLAARTAVVTWAEIAGHVRGVADLANDTQDPAAVMKGLAQVKQDPEAAV